MKSAVVLVLLVALGSAAGAVAFDRPAAAQDQRNRNFLLFEAAKRGRTAAAIDLLSQGASLDARDRFGNTALLFAARRGKTKTVAALLQAGANIHQVNLGGSNALIRAAMQGKHKTVKFLIENGADPHWANGKGVTALIATAFTGDTRSMQLLLKSGARPDARDKSGKTAIVYAAAKGFSAIAGTLLDAGIEIDTAYGNNLTALMWAAGHSDDVPEAEAMATIDLLLGRGAALNARDNRGMTALMIAVQRRHPTIALALVEVGADVGIKDAKGNAAVDLARAGGDGELARALEAAARK